jgi:hypothetical protein
LGQGWDHGKTQKSQQANRETNQFLESHFFSPFSLLVSNTLKFSQTPFIKGGQGGIFVARG